MSTASTSYMLELFESEAPSPMPLTAAHTGNPIIHNQKLVEGDIFRSGAAIAIARPSVSSDGNINTADKFASKGYEPTVLKETAVVTVPFLESRAPGMNPFEDRNTSVAVTNEAVRLVRLITGKCSRTIELMTSQVLQTGAISLSDENGNVIFALDYQPKATLIKNVTTAWAADGSTGDPLADLTTIISAINNAGNVQVNRLTFGATALNKFLANAKVLALFNKTILNVASLNPTGNEEGGYLMGRIFLGGSLLEIWLNTVQYKDPATGNMTPYVGTNNVILTAPRTRIDITFGSLMQLVAPDPRASQIFPSRPMISQTKKLALWTNPWLSPNNSAVNVDVGCRPLVVPTGIDTFGCLTVTT